MAKEEVTVIVVGAGPSGLSTAACLSNLSIPNIVLEREDCIAPLWRKYSYDSLHLHLAKPFCELALKPFPTSYQAYPSKDEFLGYMNDYAANFKISPLFRRSVESAEYDDVSNTWKVKARNLSSSEVEEYSGKFLVVSTGETSDPFVPEVPGIDTFVHGEVIHSTRYKNGEPFRGKKVLVVGSGNSGMEIAFDLSNYGAKTSLAVRSPVHVLTRDMISMAMFLAKNLEFDVLESKLVELSKLWFGDLSQYGIETPEEGPFTAKRKYGRYPIIDVGTIQKIKSGEIQVVPAVARVNGNKVEFVDGKSYPFDAIIFATGFKRSTNKWLKGDDYLLGEDGFSKVESPNHWKGKKGLYCAGLAGKGLFGAAMEAQNIANDIKQHSLSY